MDNGMSPVQAQQAGNRVMTRSDELASISETQGQLTRVYLSPEHLRANQQVAEWMQAAGMRTWQDEVGNICGRYEGQTANAPAILLGSHLDSVRNAGRYDGPLGVLTAIETVSWLHQQNIRLPVAVEVVGFADEEGTRFGITLLGSKGITGRWPESWANHPDAKGITVAQAMQACGLDVAKIGQAARRPEEIAAYLELHIEQGPCLEDAGLALGVVTAINGARRLNCRFTGLAGHAGTVPMTHRKDALAAAAEWMVFIESCTQQRGSQLVATVGTISCAPGAVNVIAGEAKLSLDIRGPQDEPLAALLETLLEQGNKLPCVVDYSSALKSSMEFRQLLVMKGCNRHLPMRLLKFRGNQCYFPAVRGMMQLRLLNAGRLRCCLFVVPAVSAITRLSQSPRKMWLWLFVLTCWRFSGLLTSISLLPELLIIRRSVV